MYLQYLVTVCTMSVPPPFYVNIIQAFIPPLPKHLKTLQPFNLSTLQHFNPSISKLYATVSLFDFLLFGDKLAFSPDNFDLFEILSNPSKEICNKNRADPDHKFETVETGRNFCAM